MPEITMLEISILTGAAVLGIILGWLGRSNRTKREKSAINAGWQEQLEAKNLESERLQTQNKNLMEQVSRFQGEDRNASRQSKELSSALKESLERRKKLELQLDDARKKIKIGAEEFRKLKAATDALPGANAAVGAAAPAAGNEAAIRERDEKIKALNAALVQWKERMQPLIEKYQKRDAEAIELEAELAETRALVAALESGDDTDDDDTARDGEDNVVSIHTANRERQRQAEADADDGEPADASAGDDSAVVEAAAAEDDDSAVVEAAAAGEDDPALAEADATNEDADETAQEAIADVETAAAENDDAPAADATADEASASAPDDAAEDVPDARSDDDAAMPDDDEPTAAEAVQAAGDDDTAVAEAADEGADEDDRGAPPAATTEPDPAQTVAEEAEAPQVDQTATATDTTGEAPKPRHDETVAETQENIDGWLGKAPPTVAEPDDDSPKARPPRHPSEIDGGRDPNEVRTAPDYKTRPLDDTMLDAFGGNFDDQIMAAVEQLETDLAAQPPAADQEPAGDGANGGSSDATSAEPLADEGAVEAAEAEKTEAEPAIPTLNIPGPAEETTTTAEPGTPPADVTVSLAPGALEPDAGDEQSGPLTATAIIEPPAFDNDDDTDDGDDAIDARDDLKRIEGIGPAIEKTLNELGFFRLRQIATMTDYDIDRIDKRLKNVRERIEAEDWMGQARRLLNETTGETA